MGLGMAMVPAGLENQLTVPLPPLMRPLRLDNGNSPNPAPLSQTSSGPAGFAAGLGVSCKTNGTGKEVQMPTVTVAYTVVAPETKAEGLAIGLVAPASENQLTVPLPPLMMPSRLVRLNCPMPAPLSQMLSGAPGGLAVGSGVMVMVNCS